VLTHKNHAGVGHLVQVQIPGPRSQVPGLDPRSQVPGLKSQGLRPLPSLHPLLALERLVRRTRLLLVILLCESFLCRFQLRIHSILHNPRIKPNNQGAKQSGRGAARESSARFTACPCRKFKKNLRLSIWRGCTDTGNWMTHITWKSSLSDFARLGP
jgi:hypothetical protein